MEVGGENSSKKCAECGSTDEVTKHHLEGQIIRLCQKCHDKEHDIVRHEDVKSLKRRLRRAKRRLRRDTKIVQETQKLLDGMKQKNES